MTLIQCPRCRRVIPVANHIGDFEHKCDSGDETLDNEDIIKLDTPGWFRQGIANGASTKARIHGVNEDDTNTRGNRIATHRTRQHYEYIDLKNFEVD